MAISLLLGTTTEEAITTKLELVFIPQKESRRRRGINPFQEYPAGETALTRPSSHLTMALLHWLAVDTYLMGILYEAVLTSANTITLEN
jgi:hypothetical protein